MLELLHDLYFADRVLHLIVLQQVQLFHRFHRVQLPRAAVPDPEDARERTFSHNIEYLKVFELDFRHLCVLRDLVGQLHPIAYIEERLSVRRLKNGRSVLFELPFFELLLSILLRQLFRLLLELRPLLLQLLELLLRRLRERKLYFFSTVLLTEFNDLL